MNKHIHVTQCHSSPIQMNSVVVTTYWSNLEICPSVLLHRVLGVGHLGTCADLEGPAMVRELIKDLVGALPSCLALLPCKEWYRYSRKCDIPDSISEAERIPSWMPSWSSSRTVRQTFLFFIGSQICVTLLQQHQMYSESLLHFIFEKCSKFIFFQNKQSLSIITLRQNGRLELSNLTVRMSPLIAFFYCLPSPKLW